MRNKRHEEPAASRAIEAERGLSGPGRGLIYAAPVGILFWASLLYLLTR